MLRIFFYHLKERWGMDGIRLVLHFVLLQIRKLIKFDFIDKSFDGDGDTVDIVVPTISKDYDLLEKYIISIKNNINHKINNIYIVSQKNDDIINFCKRYDIHFIDEVGVLGYGKDRINYVVNGLDRGGWLFQQLLKLSGDKFVEKDNYIIVDSDTFLIKRHNFIEDGKYVLFENDEWNKPYFKTFHKMFGYRSKNRLSFTSHMMVFNKEILKRMKTELESKYGTSWDSVYINHIDNQEASCVSDYETYGDWLWYNFPEKVLRKPLYNKSCSRKKLSSLNDLNKQFGHKYKSLSFHSYIKD